jgi:hypothetical protein
MITSGMNAPRSSEEFAIDAGVLTTYRPTVQLFLETKNLINKETSSYQDSNDNGDINRAKSSGMKVNLLDALKGGNPNAKFTSNNTFEVLTVSL